MKLLRSSTASCCTVEPFSGYLLPELPPTHTSSTASTPSLPLHTLIYAPHHRNVAHDGKARKSLHCSVRLPANAPSELIASDHHSLTPEFIQFLVAKDGGVGLQAFAKLDNETLFQDHLIESLNNNEIWLQANGEHLSRALKCATGAVPSQHAVAVRLTKKQGMPVLCFVVTTTGRTGKPIQLVQDCPVRPLTAAQTEELREPVVPNPDVHIMLPPVMAMKNMADRMKAISGHLIVKANMSGDFIMQVQNDLVELETFYEDLENPTIDPSQVEPSQQPSLNRDPKQFADVRIDIRDFIKFCTCHQLNPMHTICCIIENHGLVFYVYIGENGGENIGDARGCGTITYCMCLSFPSFILKPRIDIPCRIA
ncbi:Hus1-like protein-domain-containing protein [Chytriomyces sp. MP71]|nr:Hus1-like protein-domain-containing protein [Chytriomyces sp. MP71]